MKNFLKNVPLPFSPLMLSFASLGNRFKEYPVVHGFFGIISVLILILLSMKIIFLRKDFLAQMEDSIFASLFVTFPMGMMVYSTYIKTFFEDSFSFLSSYQLLTIKKETCKTCLFFCWVCVVFYKERLCHKFKRNVFL